MRDRYLCRVVDAKPYHEGRDRLISVEATLYHLADNARAYWSVTGEVYRPGARDIEAGGCIHDEVLAYWPELAPVVRLHLSDEDGTPMYAAENGLYWLGATRWDPYNRERVASHFRITPEEADALRDRITVRWKEDAAGFWIMEHDPQVYAAELARMAERWKAEAAAALEILTTMKATANGVAYPERIR